MYLTPEEERIYDGELGWAYQVSMKILTTLGELFGAKRLIPIDSAHISGVSYRTIGDAPIDFLRAVAEAPVKVKVPSSINPSVYDHDNPGEMPFSAEILEKQVQIINHYKNMGVGPTLTCTPYYLSRPVAGSHLAWSESSAVIYSNSILGAWTNREGGPSALAAALIGKVPDYGIHQPENRNPNVLVQVKTRLRREIEFGGLGIYLGKMLGDRIPVFSGLHRPTETQLKQLGAALASSGMTSIFSLDTNGERTGRLEKIVLDEEDLAKSIEELSTSVERPDLVFIGCPHCSLKEMIKVAGMLKGRKVKRDLRLWVCTSRYVRKKAKRYVEIIKSAGGKVLCDTCAVVTWPDKLGIKTLVTNSAKTAYYSPILNQVGTIFRSLDECVKSACED